MLTSSKEKSFTGLIIIHSLDTCICEYIGQSSYFSIHLFCLFNLSQKLLGILANYQPQPAPLTIDNLEEQLQQVINNSQHVTLFDAVLC